MNIILWEVANFVIDRQYIRGINSYTGDISISVEGKGNHLGKMPLLFKEDGDSVRVANIWLVHLKANLRNKYVNTQAQALLHFFTFLENTGMDWDDMPIALRLRPTYGFRKYLCDAYNKGSLARSTANSYMAVIINFYKFYLSRKHPFSNPPFNYEVVTVKPQGRHDYMRNSTIHVDTTDLRLKLPNNTSDYGLPRKLIPIGKNEWVIVEKYYKKLEFGISKSRDGSKRVPLSIEFQIAVDLCRYSGLRSSEVVTLTEGSIYKPSAEQLKNKYLINTDGLTLDPRMGVETKNETIRVAEIPSNLMLSLHKYINSPRYINRRKLYETKNPDKNTSPPLLLNQNGQPYSSKSNNARWGELRNAVVKEMPNFTHKFHNLRSTYAVERLIELLNSGIKEGKALDYLQSVMGHQDRKTLLAYLKLSDNELSANEVYESALNIAIDSEE